MSSHEEWMRKEVRKANIILFGSFLCTGGLFYFWDDIKEFSDKGGLASHFGYSAKEKEDMAYYSENNLNADLVVKGIDHETLTLGLIGSDSNVKVKASTEVREAVEYMGCYYFTVDRPIYYARQRLLPPVLAVTKKKPVIDCSLRNDI